MPVMLMMPEAFDTIAGIAGRYPNLPIVVDHMALKPLAIYEDLTAHVDALLPLARFRNVAIKASAVPCSVNDPYPFPTLREPMRRVIAAFGPERVFWGSDLTRLTCSYSEWKRFFLDELPFLTVADKEKIMGRALLAWLDWP